MLREMNLHNSNLWNEVLENNLSDVISRKLDLNSEHLSKVYPLKIESSVRADFCCENCGRKWDSRKCTVMFLYQLELQRRIGEIEILVYGQRCQTCCYLEIFTAPTIDYESADRAVGKLKQKILEKFYGEQAPEPTGTWHKRPWKERKKPHDMENCEACINGFCMASEERREMGEMAGYSHMEKLPQKMLTPAAPYGPKIAQWKIKLNGKKLNVIGDKDEHAEKEEVALNEQQNLPSCIWSESPENSCQPPTAMQTSGDMDIGVALSIILRAMLEGSLPELLQHINRKVSNTPATASAVSNPMDPPEVKQASRSLEPAKRKASSYMMQQSSSPDAKRERSFGNSMTGRDERSRETIDLAGEGPSQNSRPTKTFIKKERLEVITIEDDTPPKKKIKVSRRPLESLALNVLNIKTNKMSEAIRIESKKFMVTPEGFVEVYTDGVCQDNGKNFARAGVGIWWGNNHQLNVSRPVKGGKQTNNVAAIQAANIAVDLAVENGIKKLLINTDSQFLFHSFTQWMSNWKKNGWMTKSRQPVKSRVDLEDLEKPINFGSIQVKWNYIKGRAGQMGNEEAEKLAMKGAYM